MEKTELNALIELNNRSENRSGTYSFLPLTLLYLLCFALDLVEDVCHIIVGEFIIQDVGFIRHFL